jgi:hypothetical protein
MLRGKARWIPPLKTPGAFYVHAFDSMTIHTGSSTRVRSPRTTCDSLNFGMYVPMSPFKYNLLRKLDFMSLSIIMCDYSFGYEGS